MTATKRTVMCALTWMEISYQNETRRNGRIADKGTKVTPVKGSRKTLENGH